MTANNGSGTGDNPDAFIPQSKLGEVGMSDSIKETVPRVLKALWDLENEMRSAAQNSVILRREEARQHLTDARRHLNELLSLVRSKESVGEEQSDGSDDSKVPPVLKH